MALLHGLFLFLIGSLNIQQAISSGNVDILFHKFKLTNEDDRCCSCNNFVEKCDIYFELCLTYSRGPHCMFASIFKGVFYDSPDIMFDSHSDRFSLPLPKKSFSIRLKISDEDYFVDDYVDTVQIYMDDLSPTQNVVKGNYSLYKLTGDRSVLELKVRSYCDKGYYGDKCRKLCVPNAEGGHTCDDTDWSHQSCDDNEYFITLMGVVNEANLDRLQTGLVAIVQQFGGVEGDIRIKVSTNVDEINPGENGTIVTFCMSHKDGPVLFETIKDIFETQDDNTLNSYLPLKLFTREEAKMVTRGKEGADKTIWFSTYWYVVFIVILVVVGVVIVVAVLVILRKKKRRQTEEEFWRCHSGQNKRSEFDMSFANPFYGKTRRPSDVLNDNATNQHRNSSNSDVGVSSVKSENHYDELPSLS